MFFFYYFFLYIYFISCENGPNASDAHFASITIKRTPDLVEGKDQLQYDKICSAVNIGVLIGFSLSLVPDHKPLIKIRNDRERLLVGCMYNCICIDIEHFVCVGGWRLCLWTMAMGAFRCEGSFEGRERDMEETWERQSSEKTKDRNVVLWKLCWKTEWI